MKIDKALIQGWTGWLLNEVKGLHGSIRDKGAKYFQRPLGLGALMIFASYFYVFKSSANVVASVQQQLEAARATEKYSEEYENLKLRIDTVKGKLPRTATPEQWLTQSIRQTLREEGIDALETSAPKEVSAGGYRILTVTVKLQSNYHQVASWISRLERSKKLLFIGKLRLNKDEQSIGRNTIEVDVTTILSRGGGGEG